MMRVVFDTNIVVSGLLWTGAPAQAMDAATEGRFALIVSGALVAELRRVLLRPKFARRLQTVGKTPEQFIANYLHLVEMVEPALIPPVILEDPKDDHVLACAVGGQADCIVSGDNDLLRLKVYQAVPVLDVNSFLAFLEKRGEGN